MSPPGRPMGGYRGAQPRGTPAIVSGRSRVPVPTHVVRAAR